MTIHIGKLVGQPQDPRTYGPTDLLVDPSTYVGVEIELEGLCPVEVDVHCPLLENVEDNSLRGPSGEILFAFPLKGVDIITALDAAESYVIGTGVRPILSSRTSTHVHVDMRDMTDAGLRKFIAVYLTVERLLYHYCGKAREDNIFCVPVFKSMRQVRKLSRLLSADTFAEFKSHLMGFTEDSRYAGMNLNSLWGHGTIEFRMMHGEYRASRIREWINLLLSIKKYAAQTTIQKLKSPKQVYSTQCEAYLKEVFGEYASVLQYEGYEHDIVRGSRLQQEMLNTPDLRKEEWSLIALGAASNVKIEESGQHLTSQGVTSYSIPIGVLSNHFVTSPSIFHDDVFEQESEDYDGEEDDVAY